MALNMNPLPYLDLNHFLFTLAIIWVWVTKVHVLYFSAVASESAIQSFSELIYIWAIQKKVVHTSGVVLMTRGKYLLLAGRLDINLPKTYLL